MASSRDRPSRWNSYRWEVCLPKARQLVTHHPFLPALTCTLPSHPLILAVANRLRGHISTLSQRTAKMLSQRRSLVLASLGEAPGCGSSKAHESSPSEKCNRTPGAQKDKQDVSSIANWLLGNIPSFKSHPERWYLLYSPSRYRRIFPSVKRPSRTSSGCGDPSRRLILPSSTPDPEPVKQCASVSETSASSLSTHDNHSATPALPEASCLAIPEAAKDAIITVRVSPCSGPVVAVVDI